MRAHFPVVLIGQGNPHGSHFFPHFFFFFKELSGLTKKNNNEVLKLADLLISLFLSPALSPHFSLSLFCSLSVYLCADF